MNRPDFPKIIDNTIRSEIIRCLKKVEWGHVLNWAPSTPSIHLHAGGAFAKGLEDARRSFYEAGNPAPVALRDGLAGLIKYYGPIEAPITRTGDKSMENVVRAYDSYMQRYPLGTDPVRPHIINGKAMVEFAFSMPMEIKHPQTGDPLLYGGRADMIGLMHDQLWVTDEKTTASLGEQWAKNWPLDSQFTGYIAAAKMYGYPVAGALVRGVGLLKTKITHAEAIITRSTWEIERWWQQVHRDVQRMLRAWEEGYWDYAISKDTCAAYGGCPFEMLCKSPDPQGYLPLYFRQRTWNPLAKDSGEDLLNNPELKKQLESPDLYIPDLT